MILLGKKVISVPYTLELTFAILALARYTCIFCGFGILCRTGLLLESICVAQV